jgi:hypothetical protein
MTHRTLRVSAEDADPAYEPPPLLGFTHVVWTKRSTGEVIAVAELGEPQAPGDRDPLLWQDDGDQA